jgi:hypothetical protein
LDTTAIVWYDTADSITAVTAAPAIAASAIGPSHVASPNNNTVRRWHVAAAIFGPTAFFRDTNAAKSSTRCRDVASSNNSTIFGDAEATNSSIGCGDVASFNKYTTISCKLLATRSVSCCHV